ncbi:hypothetical protein DL96DRAFT_915347 [Flagelloscypha sp. PMI_526]|nr:hypothetical protein DL96DRAFT_915347 [Flagelloscypha sp. PMI_526]
MSLPTLTASTPLDGEDDLARKQLISPPPEDELQMERLATHSRTSSYSHQSPIRPLPPSRTPTKSNVLATTAASGKRKRTAPSSARENTPPIHTTPNPKPRKQTKRTPKLQDSVADDIFTSPLAVHRPLKSKTAAKASHAFRVKSESPGPPTFSSLSRAPPPIEDDEDDELLLVPRSTPVRATKSPPPIQTTTSFSLPPLSPMRVDPQDDDDIPSPPPLRARSSKRQPKYTDLVMSLRGSTSDDPLPSGRTSPTNGRALREPLLMDEDDEEEEEVRQMSVSLSPPPSPGLQLEDLRPMTPTSNQARPARPTQITPPSRPSSRASGLYSSFMNMSGEISVYTATELELEQPLQVASPWDTPRRILDDRNKARFNREVSPSPLTSRRLASGSNIAHSSRKSVGEAFEALKEFTARASSPSISMLPPATPTLDDSDEESEDSSQESLDLGTVKILGDKESAEKVMGILRLYNYDLKAAKTSLSSSVRGKGKLRRSYGDVEALKKSNRRSPLASGGVSKAKTPSPTKSAATMSPGLLTPVRNFFSGLFSAPSTPRFETPPPMPIMTTNTCSPPEFPADTELWTKVHWKILDACFTDERIHLAHNTGSEFEEGKAFAKDRAVLVSRVHALRKKQREGRGAAPTPLRRAPGPDASSLRKAVFDKARRELSETPSRTLAPTERVSLIATPSPPKNRKKTYGGLSHASDIERFEFPSRSTSASSTCPPLISYLSTLPDQPPTPKTASNHGLPVPPSYKSRSIATPPPPERMKDIPHKDLVDLQHVEEQRKEMERREIRRLVELNHIEPPSVVKEKEKERARMEARVPRERKTSVKDLVGSFEKLDESVRSESSNESTSGTLMRHHFSLRYNKPTCLLSFLLCEPFSITAAHESYMTMYSSCSVISTQQKDMTF